MQIWMMYGQGGVLARQLRIFSFQLIMSCSRFNTFCILEKDNIFDEFIFMPLDSKVRSFVFVLFDLD